MPGRSHGSRQGRFCDDERQQSADETTSCADSDQALVDELLLEDYEGTTQDSFTGSDLLSVKLRACCRWKRNLSVVRWRMRNYSGTDFPGGIYQRALSFMTKFSNESCLRHYRFWKEEQNQVDATRRKVLALSLCVERMKE